MAPGAGLGDVQTIDRRPGIAVIKERMRFPMAIHAARGGDPRTHGQPMIGRPVNLSFEGMTIRALDGRRLVLVRDLADIIMARGTEVLAMNGAGILCRIDLIVTGKTIFVPDLLRSTESTRTKDRSYQEAREKNNGEGEGHGPSGENTGKMP